MIRPRKFRTREARRKARRRVVLFSCGYAVLAAAIACGFVWLLHQPMLRIQTIQVHTDGVLDEAQLVQDVESAIQDEAFTILPKDSVLVVRTSELADSLTQNTPRIQDISGERSTFNTLSFSVSERTQHAWWCGDIVPSVPQTATNSPQYGKCFSVDTTGYIYATADNQPSADTSHVYYGSLAQADPIGATLLPQEEFIHLDTLYTTLTTRIDDAYALLITDTRDVELFRSNGSRIILPRNMEPTMLDNRLAALLDSDTIDQSRRLAYIDLRFGTKVFLRYRDELENESLLDTSTSIIHTQEAL